jgi:hypothetical protein
MIKRYGMDWESSLYSDKKNSTRISVPAPIGVDHEKCRSLHSKAWLEGPRIGNAPVDNAELDAFLRSDIPSISHFLPILRQSICNKQSSFLDATADNHRGSHDNLASWTHRLIYLSIYYHQHFHAYEEANTRKVAGKECQNELTMEGIGNFDYECKNAKFFVVPLSTRGLGSVMRVSAADALLTGLQEDRIVLFMNNISDAPLYALKRAWDVVSCPRKDMQCIFQPVSPCVLTRKIIQTAYVLRAPLHGDLFRLAEERQEDRVVILDKKDKLAKEVPQRTKERIMEIANLLINQLDPTDPQIPLLRNATAAIGMDDMGPNDFTRSHSPIHRAAVLYLMRPSNPHAKALQRIADRRASNDVDYSATVGLPIRGKCFGALACDQGLVARGTRLTFCVIVWYTTLNRNAASDKCRFESECLSFEQHMKVVTQIWKRNIFNQTETRTTTRPILNVLLTSESQSVFDEQQKFVKNQTLRDTITPFPLRFITNDGDVNHIKKFWHVPVNNSTADQSVVAALSSLQAQLVAKYTVGNCCSNFHNVLFDLLRGGCGFFPDDGSGKAECLQNNENPEFQVCCSPKKTSQCARDRLSRLDLYRNQSSANE